MSIPRSEWLGFGDVSEDERRPLMLPEGQELVRWVWALRSVSNPAFPLRVPVASFPERSGASASRQWLSRTGRGYRGRLSFGAMVRCSAVPLRFGIQTVSTRPCRAARNLCARR